MGHVTFCIYDFIWLNIPPQFRLNNHNMTNEGSFFLLYYLYIEGSSKHVDVIVFYQSRKFGNKLQSVIFKFSLLLDNRKIFF